MRKKRPTWMRTGEQESTRSRSKRQESRIAKVLNGRETLNSGATFGENDVLTDYAEIECKTTSKSSFPLKMTTWNLLKSKCKDNKIPLIVVDFEEHSETLVVLSLADFELLVKMTEK